VKREKRLKAKKEKQEKNDGEPDLCAGYQRQPHHAPIKLEFQHPDGHKTGLCQVCANRWLLSEEEWPPASDSKDKTSCPATNEVAN